MRLFWKALLLAAIPIGGYLLYKKGKGSTAEKSKATPETAKDEKTSPKQEDEGLSCAKVIERLSEIDGVTSRVAENLVERGIKSREALLQLSEEELKSIKGIGPKRAAKILNLE